MNSTAFSHSHVADAISQARPQRRVRSALLILVGAVLATVGQRNALADILTQYTFGPDGTTPGVLTPAMVDGNVTATPIEADAGLVLDLTNPATQPASTPYLRTTFTTVSSTPDIAIANNADFKFTLTANAGFLLDLTSLTFDVMRGGASTPRGYDVRSSIDNFAATLGTADVPTARPTFTPVVIDLTGSPFQNLTTITFKIFGYTPATGSSMDYDNIVINGAAESLPVTGYTWKGNVDSNWNTTSANWSGPGTTYVDATPTSDVIFDDTGLMTNLTVAPSPVNPDTVAFTNNTKSYTFGGAAISAASAIIKTGTGGITINNPVSAPSISFGSGTVSVGPTGSITSPSINVAAAAMLTLANGSALGATSGLIANGTVTFNSAAQNLATVGGADTGVITLNGTTLNVANDSTYDGVISGSGSIIKNTPGTLTLNGAVSDFAGGITVSAGAVRLGGASAGGTAATRVNTGGTLALAVPGTPSTTPVVLAGGVIGSIGNQTISADVTVVADSVVDVFNPISGATGSDLIITGQLLGNGNLDVFSRNGNNPDSSAFRLRGLISDFIGRITVHDSGKFELQTTSTTGSQMGTATLIVTAGATSTSNAGTYSIINVRNNSGSDVNFGNNVEVIGAGTSFFNLLGNSPAGSAVQFGDLRIGDGQGIGAVATASQAYTVGFATVHLTGGTITFTPQPVANTSFVSVENIRLGPVSETAPSGILMNGAATLTLAGTSSYTGSTIVDSGTFEVAGSITGSSDVAVNGGMLTGGGTIGTTVRIGDGDTLVAATVNPGGVNTIGTLTTGGVTLNNADAAFQFELNSDDLSKDLLAVTGTLTLGNGVAALMPTDLGFTILENSQRFVVATASAGVSGFFATYPEGATVAVGSNPMTISYLNNSITLTAIPEPGVAALLTCGLLGFAGHRRGRIRDRRTSTC
jgi:autotransporter-associated beta strand protein